MANVSAFSGSDVELKLTPTIETVKATEMEIKGFAGASDAIKFEENQEIIVTREGMDSYVFFARTGRKGGMMTIKMLPNGPSVGDLMVRAYEAKTANKNIEWNGSIEFLGAKVSADLKRGMMTHTPTFPTVGMSNIDDLQFSFYFVVIEADFSQWDFEVFSADLD